MVFCVLGVCGAGWVMQHTPEYSFIWWVAFLFALICLPGAFLARHPVVSISVAHEEDLREPDRL